MQENIEALSCDDAILYTWYHNTRDHNTQDTLEENMLYVLIAVEEEYLLEEYREIIQELMSIWGDGISVDIARHSNTLQGLTSGLTQKAGKKNPDKSDPSPQQEEQDKKEGKQSRTALQAVEYVKEHYMEFDMCLDKMAEELQVTSAYLSMIIKKQFHMSYKDYLTELRITEAKRLLLETDNSVVDICHQIGYGYVPYFIRVFQ